MSAKALKLNQKISNERNLFNVWIFSITICAAEIPYAMTNNKTRFNI